MRDCPRCKSNRLRKNGYVRGKPRFKCKDCGYNPASQGRGYPAEFKSKVIRAYLEGLGIRSLSRLFDIGVATVSRWIREYADQLPEPEKTRSVEVMEIDEMHHWIGEKKIQSGSGLRFAVIQVGYSPGSWVVVEHEPLASPRTHSKT